MQPGDRRKVEGKMNYFHSFDYAPHVRSGRIGCVVIQLKCTTHFFFHFQSGNEARKTWLAANLMEKDDPRQKVACAGPHAFDARCHQGHLAV